MGIHPAILTTRGLAAALDALARRLPFLLELDIAQVHLPPAVEASVYFFCSEAVTSITKHAQADAAWVTTIVSAGHLMIEVRDDGIGGAASMPTAHWPPSTTALDGTLEATNPPSGGTSLNACVPLMPSL